MNLILFLFLLNFFGFRTEKIKYNEDWSCSSSTESPIDIPFYNKDSRIVYQPYPSHYINKTYYSIINGNMLEVGDALVGKTFNSISELFKIKAKDSYGKVFVTIEDTYYSYSLQDIRFHVYSEHTFEGMKTELEMQLIHKWSEVDDIPSEKPTIIYLGISILFSAAWDEENEFLSVLAKTNNIYSSDFKQRYEATPITSMDLNQFFRNKNPYYYYTGSGTVPGECGKQFHWFIMNKVEKMSWKQLEQIQTILSIKNKDNIDYPNGNSRKIQDSTVRIEYVDNNNLLKYSLFYSLLLLIIF